MYHAGATVERSIGQKERWHVVSKRRTEAFGFTANNKLQEWTLQTAMAMKTRPFRKVISR
jgi:hypothetical protein